MHCSLLKQVSEYFSFSQFPATALKLEQLISAEITWSIFIAIIRTETFERMHGNACLYCSNVFLILEKKLVPVLTKAE